MYSSVFNYTHNAMESGVAICNTDIADSNFEHLKEVQEKIVDYKLDVAPAINTLAGSGTVQLKDNSINRITPTSTLKFKLPAIEANTVFHQILVQVTIAAIVSIDLGTSTFFNKEAPNLSKVGKYDLIYEYDGANWVVGCMEKGSSV